MTLGEKLDKAAQDDPRFARSVRRLRLASWIFGVGVALALAFGVWAVLVNFGQDTTINRISACERNPAGEECQQIRREAEEGESIRDLCRRFWRVGYACPRPGSAVPRQAQGAAGSGGERAAPPPPGGEAPDQPSETGGSVKDPGVSNPAPEPEGPPPESSPPPAPVASAPDPAPTAALAPPPAEPPAAVPPDPQPIREVAQEVGTTVKGAVDGVTATSCKLAPSLCLP